MRPFRRGRRRSIGLLTPSPFQTLMALAMKRDLDAELRRAPLAAPRLVSMSVSTSPDHPSTKSRLLALAEALGEDGRRDVARLKGENKSALRDLSAASRERSLAQRALRKRGSVGKGDPEDVRLKEVVGAARTRYKDAQGRTRRTTSQLGELIFPVVARLAASEKKASP
jgi:hypothetical protein